ncbi:MAG: NAD(P)-binding domain-containing protein [Planctomycetota bacterium]|nr:NAD(P)-binding domain-containing protein [Planctomycetota bacterium]MDA0932683.1 NAD(P)-binding domain-containing protein [Planctomycetota bacterium]
MSEFLSPWILPGLCALAVLAAALSVALRRSELRRSAEGLAERADARARGSDRARLQHPVIDLDQCIGCGTCVAACPEEGVLAMIHGQAAVVHGARCVGHGRCADACPVGAIALTLGDLSERDDLPALTEDLEAVGIPGLFIAGELGGYALVRTAISQGTVVAEAAARRTPAHRAPGARGRQGGVAVASGDDIPDLLIVGAGPAGIACALRATELGLRCTVIEREPQIGGAVAQYPRGKMVMTQPVRLPLHGTLPRLEYQKEELVDLWGDVVRGHDLDIRTGTLFERVTTLEEGGLAVETSRGTFRARQVCLALGRRGTPRRLGVPGEDHPKVHYSLLDAQSYRDSHLLVVGGGDSAIEAAVGLAAQPGNRVTLSYRKADFFRLKARNEASIRAAEAEGRVRIAFETTVRSIEGDRVELESARHPGQVETLPNDAVFVFAGGVPPFGPLREVGVSFDPSDRPPEQTPEVDRGTGLLLALCFAAALALGVLGFTVSHADYYGLPAAERAASPLHDTLQAKGRIGLTFGVLGVALFLFNLAYLVRRSAALGKWLPGNLRAWMSTHVFTGLAAFFCVLLHAGLAPRDTVGGHAFWALAVVVVTGTIGRYLYAFVPRATNGKELEIDQLRSRIAALSGEWDRDGRGFGGEVRRVVEQLVEEDRATWGRGFVRRIFGILGSKRRLEAAFAVLRDRGRTEGVPADEIRSLLALARRAHRLMLAAAHFAEVRAVLGSWRYLHRWLALLMVLLTGVHVYTAVRFADIDWSVLLGWPGGPQ